MASPVMSCQSIVSSDSISLSWKAATEECDYYVVKYRQADAKATLLEQKQTLENKITLTHLKSDTTYTFGVYSVKDGEDTLLCKTTTKTNDSTAKKFLEMSEKIGSDPNIYRLKPEKIIPVTDDVRIVQLFSEPGNQNRNTDEKSILLLGQTGCGKRTLIDAMINYILGASNADDFRFSVIQNQTMTTVTTCYKLPFMHKMKISYGVNIIDVPGISAKNEALIMKQLFTLFDSDFINYLDAACLVIPGICRLTMEDKYMIDTVLSIFGKDINCIVPIVTHDDGGQTEVFKSLTKAHVPFIDHMCFRYNNATLFHAFEPDEVWQRRNTSLRKFFDALSVTVRQSLKDTKEVIKLRESMQVDIRHAEALKREIEKKELKIKKIKSEIDRQEKIQEDNENYMYREEEYYDSRKQNNTNDFLNCNICKQTCKRNLPFWFSLFWCFIKIWYWCGGVTCNENGCHCLLERHIKENAVFVKEYRIVTKPDVWMKKNYESSLKEHSSADKQFKLAEDELKAAIVHLKEILLNVNRTNDYLKSVAMKHEVSREIKNLHEFINQKECLDF